MGTGSAWNGRSFGNMLKSFQESWHKLSTLLCEFFCGFGHCVFSWLWEEFSDRLFNVKCSKSLKQNSQNQTKILPKSSENGVKMGSKSVFKSVSRRSAFWKINSSILGSKWRPSWTHVGDIFGGFWVSKTFFERSSFPRWFWSDFEAIWEPRGKAKTSVSLQRGFSFQLFVTFSFSIAFSSILEAKMELKSSPNGVQDRL